MAWDPNEKGNPAWLTKQASEHGGVDNFIDDIHNEGFDEGREQGVCEGAAIGTIVTIVLYGVCKGIKHLINKYKLKKQVTQERAREAEAALREMCEDDDEYTENHLEPTIS